MREKKIACLCVGKKNREKTIKNKNNIGGARLGLTLKSNIIFSEIFTFGK